MRYIPLIPAFLAARSLAAPQQIDFLKIDQELPETTLTIPVTAEPTIISYDPTAAIEAVAEPTNTGLVLVSKRDTPQAFDNSGCSACPVQPTIANSYNVDVSSDANFLADAAIASTANNAVTPSGYTKVYTNLKAASNGYVYMGYQVMESTPAYDPSVCATKCNSIAGCLAFNIFFERNPTVDACSSTCQDPPAFANIKCSFWGGALTVGSAKNNGQWRNKFHVVIAGSNAYVNSNTPSVPGYSPVQSLGAAAINAPYDCNNLDTYLGYKLFTNTPFDVKLCAAACDAQTGYNLAHPPAPGQGLAKKCNFWNTYLLDRNGESQGQYCAMYTQQWDSSYAKNTGQWRGSDQYTISSSYSSFNLTSPGLTNCGCQATK